MSMFKTKEDYAIIHRKEANNGRFDIKMMTMNLFKIFRSKRHQKEPQKEPTDLYKMNVLQPDAANAAGPAVSFSCYVNLRIIAPAAFTPPFSVKPVIVKVRCCISRRCECRHAATRRLK